jgi:hypothetical protein
MQDKTVPKSPEALSRELALIRSLPIKELKQQVAIALQFRTAASRQPRIADPCGGIPHSGTSPRRTQTVHS